MTTQQRLWTSGLILVCMAALSLPASAEQKILRLRVNGPMMEAPNDAAGLFAALADESFTTLHDWTTQVEQAAADSDIAGMVLIIESPVVSLAQIEEMTRAIKQFRKTGKPVHAYMDYGDNATYALAAAADHVTLAETSELMIVGLHAELMYFKGLLDKIGVEAEMLRCGDYKSAVEPYTRTQPSEEAAENMNWLLDGIFERWLEMIANGRDMSVDQVRTLVDQAPLSAMDALEAGLVDEVSSFPAFKKRMHKEFGKDVVALKEYEKSIAPEIDMNNPFALFQMFQQMMEPVTEEKDPGVGLIYIAGAIMVGPSDDDPFSGQTAGSTTIRAAIESAREDDEIRAVVLRIDSPGGSALASDIIWNAAERLASEKPLIVSMGRVAASGGYYVASPGDTIFAEASTITGSIGVLGGKLVLNELMESKLGITTASFSRGKRAGLFSAMRGWDDSERAWLREYIDKTYAQFKSRVEDGRGDRLQKPLDKIAGGRVFTGAQALELGLVDKLGGLGDALDYAAKEAALGDDYEVYVLPKGSELQELLAVMSAIMGGNEKDEFEIGARLRNDVLLRAGIPAMRQLAPAQVAEIMRQVHNLTVLQREHVGCFVPAIPVIR